jgi:gamma-glutamyltranspeptidase/glutathione hydrolase
MRLGSTLSVLVAVLALSFVPGAAADRPLTKQATAQGTGGAVASDSTYATQAGLSVLRRGGTAADAAVAVASTLGVTDPYVAGIGGGGYFVYYDARTHRVSTIDGRETAPAADGQNMFIDAATGQPLSFPTAVTSGLSVGVPGTLATWQKALDRWGRRGLAADLKPAIRVARKGFTVDATLQELTRENQGRFAQFSSTSSLFLPGGALPAVGSVLRNPDLAATYRQIARNGIGALYGGPIGADVVDAVHNLPLAPAATLKPIPGPMTLQDLRGYRAIDRDPTHVNYRGVDVYSMAPSSSGGSTVGEALNILKQFDLSGMDRVQLLHHYLEATRLAFADRNRFVGDPAFVNVPLAQLLSDSFGLQRACLIDPAHALTSPVAPGDPNGSPSCTAPATAATRQDRPETHTNHFVVSDRWGDVVSYTNTIEQLGGSGIVVPGRGFLLNNELTDFNFTGSEPAGGRQAATVEHVPDDRAAQRAPVRRSRRCRRRDDHHDRARHPDEPHRPRDDVARCNRSAARIAAQLGDDAGRARLHRPADDAGARGARAEVRGHQHVAARSLDQDPADDRRRDRARGAPERAVAGGGRADPPRRRLGRRRAHEVTERRLARRRPLRDAAPGRDGGRTGGCRRRRAERALGGPHAERPRPAAARARTGEQRRRIVERALRPPAPEHVALVLAPPGPEVPARDGGVPDPR